MRRRRDVERVTFTHSLEALGRAVTKARSVTRASSDVTENHEEASVPIVTSRGSYFSKRPEEMKSRPRPYKRRAR